MCFYFDNQDANKNHTTSVFKYMSLRTTYLVQKRTNLLVLNVIYLKIEGVKNNKIICKHFGRIELSKQRTGTHMISRMKYGCRI